MAHLLDKTESNHHCSTQCYPILLGTSITMNLLCPLQEPRSGSAFCLKDFPLPATGVCPRELVES